MLCASSPLIHTLYPSPNIEPRRGKSRADMLVLHYTGMMDADRAIWWLAQPQSKVSCHYVIDEAGRITQMVAESDRAWHAGLAYWGGETDINSASIGIEIHNPGHELGYPEFPEAQMAAVVALSRDIVERNEIPAARVLAHSDVAPGRKIDPGEKFDWRRLHRSGVGHWIEPAPLDADDLGIGVDEPSDPLVEYATELLARYGYDIPRCSVLDIQGAKVVRSFQLHFRPARTDGRLDRSTVSTLEALLAALETPPSCGGDIARL